LAGGVPPGSANGSRFAWRRALVERRPDALGRASALVGRRASPADPLVGSAGPARSSVAL
jgi:hypothetical protein